MRKSISILSTLLAAIVAIAFNAYAIAGISNRVICDKKNIKFCKSLYSSFYKDPFLLIVLDRNFYAKYSILYKSFPTSNNKKDKNYKDFCELVDSFLMDKDITQCFDHTIQKINKNIIVTTLTTKGIKQYYSFFDYRYSSYQTNVPNWKVNIWTLKVPIDNYDNLSKNRIVKIIARHFARKFAYLFQASIFKAAIVHYYSKNNSIVRIEVWYNYNYDKSYNNFISFNCRPASSSTEGTVVFCMPFRRSLTSEVYSLIQLKNNYTGDYRGILHCKNDACTIDTGTIKVNYSKANPQNFKIDAPFKVTVNRHILRMLRKRGFHNNANYDLTSSFIGYLARKTFPNSFYTDPPKKAAVMAVRLYDMLLKGNVSFLDKLIQNFVQNLK